MFNCKHRSTPHPTFRFAKAHLLPQGEKGIRGSSALEPPSPLVGEGLGVRGAAMSATQRRVRGSFTTLGDRPIRH